MSRIFSFFTVCGLLLAMAACGGGSSQQTQSATPTPTPAALTVSPTLAQVQLGSSLLFIASGPGAPVNWQVNGIAGGNATFGTIDPNGLYHAPTSFPSPNTFNVTAVSQADATKQATAGTTVVYPNNNAGSQLAAIKLGTSGGDVLDESSSSCCIGTLGSLITRGGAFFLLSNNHVLGRSDAAPALSASDVISQPGPSQCFAAPTTVGTSVARAALKPTTGTTGNAPSNVDAAIAQLSSNTVVDNVAGVPTGSILDLGAAGPTSIAAAPPSATLATPAIGLAVAKSGRTTGLTCSTISAIAATVSVPYFTSCESNVIAFTSLFGNQILIDGGSFSAGGDSGSLIVTQGQARPVGLLYAGSPSNTAANPIAEVLANFQSGANAATIVGGADHPVNCLPTATANGTQVGTGQSTQISTRQQEIAANARDRNGRALMSLDPAIRSVQAGASADSAGEGALVIELSAASQTRIPAVVDGVRTKVVYAQGVAVPGLSNLDVYRTIAIKDAHVDALMAQEGIQAVGVGASKDSPGEPAIMIYTILGANHPPIPATIDGVRTRVIEDERFRAFGWNAHLEKKPAGCAKPKTAAAAK